MTNNTAPPPSFHEFQQQSEIGTIVEFFFLLRRNMRGMLVLTLYLLFKLEWYEYYLIAIGLILIVCLLSLSAYLSYKNTTFKIDTTANEFLLNKGIFNKSKVSIQLDKIIQVNINQNFIQRLVKVYSVEIETAGSVRSEAVIKALDKEVAFALKQSLLEESKGVDNRTQDDSEINVNESSIVHNKINIKPQQLIKYAFTTDYIRSSLILLGILFSFYSRIQEYLQNFRVYEEHFENAAIEFYEAQSIYFLIGALFIFAIFINAIRNIITYFQMEIKLSKDLTWITYGLFSRINTVLQNSRTQIFTIITNPIQRYLNIFKLEITQISSDIDTDKKAKITIAGAGNNQIQQLFQHIYKREIPLDNVVLNSNARMLILPYLLGGVLPAIALAILIWNRSITGGIHWFFIGYLVILILLLRRHYHSYQLSMSDGIIIKQQKMWREKTQLIQIDTIQAVYTEQYIWQKNSNLGNLIIQTAGGQITFKYGDFTAINQLANYLLYKIENTEKGWTAI